MELVFSITPIMGKSHFHLYFFHRTCLCKTAKNKKINTSNKHRRSSSKNLTTKMASTLKMAEAKTAKTSPAYMVVIIEVLLLPTTRSNFWEHFYHKPSATSLLIKKNNDTYKKGRQKPPDIDPYYPPALKLSKDISPHFCDSSTGVAIFPQHKVPKMVVGQEIRISSVRSQERNIYTCSLVVTPFEALIPKRGRLPPRRRKQLDKL